MDTLQAVLLGIVQGITEFLPVSSSGHLQIAKELLGVEIENNITFDVTLHAATVLSTLVVMRAEVARLANGLFERRYMPEQAYVLKIFISMIPAGIVGVVFGDRLEEFFGSLWFVGIMLLATAALLAFAYYARPRQKSDISYRDAFIIGIAQAAATLPGLSRSGSTIATGLLLGDTKPATARFSFLMVIPIILGKMVIDVLSGDMASMSVPAPALAGGFIAAFVVGALACKIMIRIVERGRLVWFALYCAVMGSLCIGFSIF